VTDMDDLIARLRHGEGQDWDCPYATRAEAADALQSLAAELDAEKAKHRETLAVLQTAHEGEEAAQATIRRLMNDLQAHKDALAQVEPRAPIDYDAAHLLKGGKEIRIEFDGKAEAGRFFAELQSRSFAAIHTSGDDA